MSVWEKIKQGTRDTAIATKLTAQKTALLTEISILNDKIKAQKQVRLFPQKFNFLFVVSQFCPNFAWTGTLFGST